MQPPPLPPRRGPLDDREDATPIRLRVPEAVPRRADVPPAPAIELEGAHQLVRIRSNERRQQESLGRSLPERRAALRQALDALELQATPIEMANAVRYLLRCTFLAGAHQTHLSHRARIHRACFGRFSSAGAVLLALGYALDGENGLDLLEEPPEGWSEAAAHELRLRRAKANATRRGAPDRAMAPPGPAAVKTDAQSHEVAPIIVTAEPEPEPVDNITIDVPPEEATHLEPPPRYRKVSDELMTLVRTVTATTSRVGEEFTCSICFCSELVENSITLLCRHRFCRECVSGYIESKINDGVLTVTCPDLMTTPRDEAAAESGSDVGCPEMLSEELICELISPAALAKYCDGWIPFVY